MIKVENISVSGWEAAIRGMRNPMNSWDRSDSHMVYGCDTVGSQFMIGHNDLNLMQRLFKGGTEHRKYLRMINVTMDITAPLYWWKEFDTYKVGTVANSCSTMHKIHAKEFTLDDFSCEHLTGLYLRNMKSIIISLNDARDFHNVRVEKLKNRDLTDAERKHTEAQRKYAWLQMIQLLPSSYNQKRTVQMSYETLFNIIRQRDHHKLNEWNKLVDILKNLPYVKEIGDLG